MTAQRSQDILLPRINFTGTHFLRAGPMKGRNQATVAGPSQTKLALRAKFHQIDQVNQQTHFIVSFVWVLFLIVGSFELVCVQGWGWGVIMLLIGSKLGLGKLTKPLAR